MTKEEVTLIAALIAALTSIVSLGLNSRLAVMREKRMMLWEKELQRLHDLEEKAGIAQEIALSCASPEIIEKEFHPLHDELRHAAGRFGRYPELAKAIRELNHACAVTVAEKVEHGDSREWSKKIKPAHTVLLKECDAITKREKT
ncbi:hypothetical protein ACMXYV_09095 [Neptuniibacter sp. SY11_33]|uniref:hypothetical protein n=1 Tax=Neptuniibacter sp. SY11_33 TaxID=3398215 RepID=UPI0039F56A92